MKKEQRNNGVCPTIRAKEGEESRTIEGYALVFDSRSVDLGDFTETIHRDSLEGVLERSDVLALYNHDINRGVLARNRQGAGSLELKIDDRGLLYRFEAPKTALGDELLEGVRRGDITGSSFAFTVAEDRWARDPDGNVTREILRFGELFDVSPVVHPAYEATSVDLRGLDALKEEERKRAEEEKEKEECSEDPDEKDEEKDSPTAEPEPDKGDDKEDSPTESDKGESDKEKEEDKSSDKKERNNNNHIKPEKKMKREKFSLLGAISAVVQKRQQDDATAYVIEKGREAALRSGISTIGSIVLPTSLQELRFEDAPTGILASQNEEAATYGGEAVPTDMLDILGPLQEKLVVSQLGARMLTLSGNVEIPTYSGATVNWESEIGKAKDGAGKFGSIKMSPKRITAEIAISKQFLIQTDGSAEALVRQDLIDKIAIKLQQTMFGKGAGDDKTPAGLFNGVSAESADLNYAGVVAMEAQLEKNNVYGPIKYVLSPDVKAALRTTPLDAGSGRFVMESGEVLGIPAYCTGGVTEKGLILGDWSNLYIANFGAIDLTVDEVTLAANAQIRLVVNAWFDFAVVRPEAFVKKILK